jgi:hypothetical protein
MRESLGERVAMLERPAKETTKPDTDAQRAQESARRQAVPPQRAAQDAARTLQVRPWSSERLMVPSWRAA